MVNFKDYISDQINQADALVQNDEILSEKMWFDYKTRNGKKTKKWHTDRKNYRIQLNKKTGQPKEVYITPTERLKRKIGQRKAAIKRRAKQKNITAKRLKSFGVRKNFGMKYDTEGHVIKRHKGAGSYDPYLENNGLYPNMLESQLLLEFPHIQITDDLWWDFYEEKAHQSGEWLMQLVSLYKDHKMISLNAGTDDDNNNCEETGTKNGEMYVSPGTLEEITYTLCQDTWFLQYAREGYKKLSEQDRELFDLYVDERLLLRIIPEELL